VICSFSYVQECYPKNFSEDEQLIRVGIGAFKDGFYDIAEKQFSNFIRFYPKHNKVFDICYLLGRTLLIQGKSKEAMSLFSKIVEDGKHFENMDYALLRMAEVKIRLGSRDEAAKYLLSIIKNFPKFEQIGYTYYLLGLLEFGSNQLAASESTFKKVSQYSKNNELIHSSFFWLGILSFKQRQYETAVGYFQNLWENHQSLPPEYIRYALFWLGEAQLKSGRFNEAKLSFKTFYERFRNDPLLPEAYWKIGFCEYQLGNIQNAIETFQWFKNQFKDSPLFLYTHYLLGEIFLLNNDHLSSIKENNSILNPSQGMIWGGAFLLTLYWDYIHVNEMEGANRISQRLQKSNHFEDDKIFIQWLNAEISFSIGEISDSLPYYFNIVNTQFREKALFQIEGVFSKINLEKRLLTLIFYFWNSRILTILKKVYLLRENVSFNWEIWTRP
jgi:TolA-binding protein